MKKTLLSGVALLFALSLIGCQPPAIESTDDSAMKMDAPAGSNVTATAETPAMTETPAAPVEAPAVAAPAVEAPAAPAVEAPAAKPAE